MPRRWSPRHWPCQTENTSPALFPTTLLPLTSYVVVTLNFSHGSVLPCSFTPPCLWACWLFTCIIIPAVQYLTGPFLWKLVLSKNCSPRALIDIVCISTLVSNFLKCNCSSHVCLSRCMTSPVGWGAVSFISILWLCIFLCIFLVWDLAQRVYSEIVKMTKKEGGESWI